MFFPVLPGLKYTHLGSHLKGITTLKYQVFYVRQESPKTLELNFIIKLSSIFLQVPSKEKRLTFSERLGRVYILMMKVKRDIASLLWSYNGLKQKRYKKRNTRNPLESYTKSIHKLTVPD